MPHNHSPAFAGKHSPTSTRTLSKTALVLLAGLGFQLPAADFTVGDNLILNGSNSWIQHSPDDGRTELYVAPKKNGNWSWSDSFVFYNTGSMSLPGDLILNGSNAWIMHSPNDGRTDLYIAPKINGNWSWTQQFTFKNDGTLCVPYFKSTGTILVSKHAQFDSTLTCNESIHCKWLTATTGGYFQGALGADGQIYSKVGYATDGFVNAKGGITGDSLTITNGIRANSVRTAYVGTAKLQVRSDYWADNVLAEGYQLTSLAEVNAYIQAKGHLPGVPSEAELQKTGVDVHAMLAIHMGKIEELTLHAIRQQETIERQAALIERLSARLDGRE